MAGKSIQMLVVPGLFVALWCALAVAAPSGEPVGTIRPVEHRGGFFLSGHAQRKEVLSSLPFDKLTAPAQAQIRNITDSPTLYRRLPTQAIQCEQEMFLFLARNPEVLVGMWEMMGISKVQTRRAGQYQLEAVDGMGTTCSVDLVYGDQNLHVFVAEGEYDGRLATAPIQGRGVFVLRSTYARSSSGQTTVTGALDCFLQLDNLGADLVARTFSGLIGRSADHNYTETARFISQVSQMSRKNPPAMIELAERLPQVDGPTRQRFITAIAHVAQQSHDQPQTAQASSQAPAR